MIESIFISLPMLVCALCLLFVLMKWYEFRTPSLLHLATFFFVAGLLYVGHYAYFTRRLSTMPATDTLYSMCNLAVYPLFLNYVLSLTGSDRPRGVSRRVSPLLLLLPSLVVGLTVAVLYGLMSAEQTRVFVLSYLYTDIETSLDGLVWVQALVHRLAKVFFAVTVVVVILVGSREIKAHDRYVRDTFADTDRLELRRLRILLYLFAVTSLFSILSLFLGRQLFETHHSMLVIPSVVFSVLLALIGYDGLFIQIPQVKGEPVIDLNEPKEAEVAAAPADTMQIKRLAESLLEVLEGEALYLKPDLRIVDLSKRLNTNRFYLSKAINDELGTTFSGLINKLRVDYAIALMRSHPEMSIVEVAEKSGYQSHASFYRNFKAICGCSPKNYCS